MIIWGFLNFFPENLVISKKRKAIKDGYITEITETQEWLPKVETRLKEKSILREESQPKLTSRKCQ
ncbi:hypothetical protein AVDCRST_MAG92-1355 [uncultured Coleofasciculus sp.]|uniref:Uncharacterized protein n=1 Tax=uncultured Coleofasciculus sp. TaxID=1267456 RepID=A0A6J4HZ15_9CYAN|nr:hypothetical protein AVDCRST_MAG92-1355 [uncultured Coleofasciculus sp.]